jgi:phosphatidylglycerophosphate synthase
MTVLCIVAGLASAVFFTILDQRSLYVAAALAVLYAVLDCADGQLARARGTASRMGRILDGMCDFAVGFGMGGAIAYRSFREDGIATAVAALVGGASLVVGGVLFDYFKNRYLAHSGASYREGNDLEETRAARAQAVGIPWLLLGVYVFFLRIQGLAGGKPPRSDSPVYARLYHERLAPVARAWAYLGGPTTHVSLLAVLACFDKLAVYVWARAIVANVLIAALFFEQWRRERSIHRDLGIPAWTR